MLGRSGRTEEVRLGARCEDQVVPGYFRSQRRGDRASVRVDRCDARMPDFDCLVVAKDPAQRSGDVIGGQLGGGHLIQHRLELVVVVLVEQNDVDVILGELLGAGNPGEPTSHNEHGRCVTHASSPLSKRRQHAELAVSLAIVQPAASAGITLRG